MTVIEQHISRRVADIRLEIEEARRSRNAAVADIRVLQDRIKKLEEQAESFEVQEVAQQLALNELLALQKLLEESNDDEKTGSKATTADGGSKPG